MKSLLVPFLFFIEAKNDGKKEVKADLLNTASLYRKKREGDGEGEGAKKGNVSGRVCITRYEVYQANFCRKLRIPMIQMFVGRKKKSRKWEEEEEDLGYCCPITVEKVNMLFTKLRI